MGDSSIVLLCLIINVVSLNVFKKQRKKKSLTDKGPLEDQLQILTWIIPLAKGYHQIHELKIYGFLNLTPANLVLDNQNDLKIGHFVLEKQDLAPKLEGKDSKYSDMYSMGKIILSLLSVSINVDIKMIESIPNSYSKKWRGVVESLFDERPPSAMALKSQLEDIQFDLLKQAISWYYQRCTYINTQNDNRCTMCTAQKS